MAGRVCPVLKAEGSRDGRNEKRNLFNIQKLVDWRQSKCLREFSLIPSIITGVRDVQTYDQHTNVSSHSYYRCAVPINHHILIAIIVSHDGTAAVRDAADADVAATTVAIQTTIRQRAFAAIGLGELFHWSLVCVIDKKCIFGLAHCGDFEGDIYGSEFDFDDWRNGLPKIDQQSEGFIYGFPNYRDLCMSIKSQLSFVRDINLWRMYVAKCVYILCLQIRWRSSTSLLEEGE